MKNFKYFNVRPDGAGQNDCVRRAIVSAFGLPYEIVKSDLTKFARRVGQPFKAYDEVVKPYLVNLGATNTSFPAVKGEKRMNGLRFTESHPKGRYVLSMAHHLTACVDGVILDTWDCTDKCVYTAWKVPDDFNVGPVLTRL